MPASCMRRSWPPRRSKKAAASSRGKLLRLAPRVARPQEVAALEDVRQPAADEEGRPGRVPRLDPQERLGRRDAGGRERQRRPPAALRLAAAQPPPQPLPQGLVAKLLDHHLELAGGGLEPRARRGSCGPSAGSRSALPGSVSRASAASRSRGRLAVASSPVNPGRENGSTARRRRRPPAQLEARAGRPPSITSKRSGWSVGSGSSARRRAQPLLELAHHRAPRWSPALARRPGAPGR